MIVQDIAQSIAGYFDFLIDFVSGPGRAFAPYARSAKVSKDLTLFAIVGVGIALAVSATGGALELRDDTSVVLATLSKLREANPQLLPILGVLLSMLVAAALHILVWLVQRDAVSGSVKDSINAGLAFSAMFVPLTAFAIAVLLRVAGEPGSLLPGVVGVALAVVAFVYFALAMRGAHAAPARARAASSPRA